MAARCASVGAWESAADTISNEAPASDAKNIDARFNLSITWNHLSVFARRTIEQPRNRIRSKFNGRQKSRRRASFCLSALLASQLCQLPMTVA
jgi:hypothetical protein